MTNPAEQWWPWEHLNLRGDPSQTHGLARGQAVFIRSPQMRPMVVMLDEHLLARASSDPRVKYLLELLAVDPIQTHLYSDKGAPPSQLRTGKEQIEHVPGWIHIVEADESSVTVALVNGAKPSRLKGIRDKSAYRDTLHPAHNLAAEDQEQVESDAMAMLIASLIQADLFITDRPYLLSLAHNPWTRTTVLEPKTALPNVGLYLRLQGKYIRSRVPRIGSTSRLSETRNEPRYMFYWYAAINLLPAMSAWENLCDRLDEIHGSNDQSILAASLIQRLSQILQCRDHLLGALAVPQDNDTADDALNQLDQLLIWLMAAFDITARVAHVAMGLKTSIRGAGWQGKRWLKQFKDDYTALYELATGVQFDGRHALLVIISELRNSVHSQALSASGLIPGVGEHELDLFLALPSGSRENILRAMDCLGGQELWGAREPLKGYGLFVHPGQLVERLLPMALALLSDLMRNTPAPVGNGEGPTSWDYAMPISVTAGRFLWQLGIEPLSPVAEH